MAAEYRDIVVVGGGIIGMLTARELALAGARVILLERGECGRESSWAGGGIVSPLYPWRYPESVTALASWSQAHYPQLARTLAEESGVDPEWLQSGMLMLDVEEADEARSWATGHGHEMAELTGGPLREVEPELACGERGLWMPRIGQVRNPRLARAARLALDVHGIEVRERTEVTGFTVQGGRIGGVKTAGEHFTADRVIVASGAWSGQLLRELGVEAAVAPVKGQMILYRAEPGRIRHIVLDRGKYVIPRRDGHILAGSTLEHAEFDKTTTDEALAELKQVAERMFPFLAETPVIKQWAGLRPGSPSGVPYIGEHPSLQGLFVNAGHFRNGVVLGPASARLMADLVLNRKTIVESDPYSLDAPR